MPGTISYDDADLGGVVTALSLPVVDTDVIRVWRGDESFNCPASDVSDYIQSDSIGASEVGIADVGTLYASTNVEDALQNELAPANFVASTGGDAGGLVTLSAVTGATTLDLANGNAFDIESSAGAFTLSVTNHDSRYVSYTVHMRVTHTPTFPGNATFPNDDVTGITWDGTEQIFQVISRDGGTTDQWFHLTPLAAIEQETYSFGASPLLVDTTGRFAVPNRVGDRVLVGVVVYLTTPPVTSPVVIDMFIDGVTIFTTPSNRPSVSVGSNESYVTTIENPNWDLGSVLTAHIVSTDTGAAADGLTVTPLYRRA